MEIKISEIVPVFHCRKKSPRTTPRQCKPLDGRRIARHHTGYAPRLPHIGNRNYKGHGTTTLGGGHHYIRYQKTPGSTPCNTGNQCCTRLGSLRIDRKKTAKNC